jgi:molybdate transport system regulatory protein
MPPRSSLPAPTKHGRHRDSRLELRGLLWIASGVGNLGGPGRIALLGAVAEHGSLNQAAKKLGLSYKAAWSAINRMNALAGEPLVERAAGGRGGGYTRLTEHGRRFVERFEQLDLAHRRFVAALDRVGMDLGREFSLVEVLNMKTSARNQWEGTVTTLRAGAVNDEVEITLDGGATIVATVTRESTAALSLRVHQRVIALVKSSSIVLATGLSDARVSAGNRLDGAVTGVVTGAVNSEVALDAGNLPVVAVVARSAVESLGLVPGVAVSALVKPSDVILAVLD